MKTWLRAMIVLPVAVLLIGFALANRSYVTIDLDPFNLGEWPVSFNIPLFLPVYLGMTAGVIVGGAAMWFTQGKYRRAVRMHRHTIDMQRRELDRVTTNHSLPPPPFPPVG
jgi:uncharacterized integral membrane protein